MRLDYLETLFLKETMQPSPIQWCEEDYVHSPYIAEYWNTWTNLAYVIAGALCYGRSQNPHIRLNVMSVFMMLTGVASAAFHGTLLWWTQKFDEAALSLMMISAMHTAYRLSWAEWWAHSLVVCCFLYKYDTLVCEIHTVITVLVLWHHLAKLYRAYPTLANSCLMCIAFSVAGFSVWLADWFFCEYVQPYHLHALWHIFTAVGLGLLWEILYWEDRHRKKKY